MSVFMSLVKKIDLILVVLLIIAAVFIFANLGNIYLWQDEATTAVIARNTLAHGLPYGYKIFTPEESASNPKQIWFFQPWLQFYVTALSFFVFGESTWAARFPFAVFGLGTCLLTYFLSLKLTADKTVARISTFLLTLSVPFLLHVRQCRYYALTAFLTLLAMLAYWRFLHRKRYSAAGFAIALILLFYGNYAAFGSISVAFFIHYIITQRKAGFNRRLLTRDIATLSAVFIFTASFFFYVKVLQRTDVALELWTGNFSSLAGFLEHAKKQLEFYVRTLTKFVFPAVFFVLLWIVCLLSKRKFLVLPGKVDRRLFNLIILVMAVSLVFFVVVAQQRHFRYIVFLLPLFYILQGVFFAGWIKVPQRRLFAISILVVLVSSNLLFRPYDPKFRLFDFMYEITHDYDDVTEGIVKFLNENAKPGETVKVPYDLSPIVFYTKGLNVYWKCGKDFVEDETYPDWIIYRRFWVPREFFKSRYYRNIRRSYQQIELTGYRDLKWGNMPDPGEHRYRTETDYPERVPIIYKKKKG